MLFLFLVAATYADFVVPSAKLQSAPYAEWAHYHWVWLSADRANQTSNIEFVQEFLDHNISVGGIDCDSNWQTGYNTFVFNSKYYPNATDMVQYFHNIGIRVIFWTVSMVNVDSPNYQTGLSGDYYIKRGNGEVANVNWWHGTGAFLDYSNPNALNWWHSQVDNALAAGIDGWKCDGTDPYIFEVPDAVTFNGSVTHREYADAYYGDFFDYARLKNGPDCLIMSRPVDGAKYHTPVYLPFSPRRVVFSGWTGDDDADFGGLRSAITKFLLSAEANYTNYGSDIGGYRYDSQYPLGRSKESFIRWAQTCAFVPLMENGGNGEHRPWAFDTNGSTTIVDTYRKFVAAHYELVPYLLSEGTAAYETETSVLHPVTPIKLVDDPVITPDFDFYLGYEFLVCPIVYNETARQINFPGPATRVYTSYWNPREVFKGGQNVTYPCPLTTLPVFILGGSIIPLRVVSDLTGRGTHHFPEALTIAITRPLFFQMVTKNIYEYQRDGVSVSYFFTPTSLAITSTSFDRDNWYMPEHPLRKITRQVEHAQYSEILYSIDGVCFSESIPLSIRQITVDGVKELLHISSLEKLSSSDSGYHYDATLSRLVIRPIQSHLGVKLDIQHVNLFTC